MSALVATARAASSTPVTAPWWHRHEPPPKPRRAGEVMAGLGRGQENIAKTFPKELCMRGQKDTTQLKTNARQSRVTRRATGHGSGPMSESSIYSCSGLSQNSSRLSSLRSLFCTAYSPQNSSTASLRFPLSRRNSFRRSTAISASARRPSPQLPS